MCANKAISKNEGTDGFSWKGVSGWRDRKGKTWMMSDRMRQVMVDFPASREREALELLRRLVEIQSGSRNKAGLDRMADAMAEVLGRVLPHVRLLPFEEHGNMVQAWTAAGMREGSGRILLVGHMDTVFPEDTAFTHYREDELHCYGPGVYDMKGGLVVGVYALEALDHLGLLDEIPLTFLCNSDEEIGSPASRSWIEEQAEGCRAAFVLEGAGLNGEVVTGRKGRLGFRLTVRGRAGHAAGPGPKASAILELAHKVIALEGLNGDPQITVNVGRIEGGIGPNTVPEQAEALVDVRFFTAEDQLRAERAIEDIVRAGGISGVTSEMNVIAGRPPMPASEGNRRLFGVVRDQARLLGYECAQEVRSGVSDANFIAPRGVPVLDGLGPVGDLDHSDREYIVKRSVMERAALLAASLAALPAATAALEMTSTSAKHPS